MHILCFATTSIDASTSPPRMDPSTPNTIFPLLPDNDIATGLQLDVEFCVSFELMLRYVPDTQPSYHLLWITSQKYGSLFSLGVKDGNLLAVWLTQNGANLGNTTVDENILNLYHTAGSFRYRILFSHFHFWLDPPTSSDVDPEF